MKRIDGSFRDPSGFLFFHNNALYRQVNACGGPDYDQLMTSGLHAALTQKQWLVNHEEVEIPLNEGSPAHRILKPQLIPFVSYPYEWSFSQLKDAALLTLKVQSLAFKHGMVLKDASAYNIQFRDGRPIMIDTLSFIQYEENQPWVAYKQFCQHFLAPLLLMAKLDVRLNQLSRLYIDGVPLDLASALLPKKTWFSPGILLHIHFHAKAQKAFAETDASDIRIKKRIRPVSRNGLLGIVSSLESLIQGLNWQPSGTEWADYYENTNYSDTAFTTKSKIIESYLDQIQPSSVWDLGANTGLFSRLAAKRGIQTIAFDIDPAAVEINYLQTKVKPQPALLPLVLDLTNPSPALGWAHRERFSLLERGGADCVFALALIHHLCISNNIPLENLAGFLAQICEDLILEFVPKSDSQVKRLLSSRSDIFDEYNVDGFEQAFYRNFEIKEKCPVDNSERILYWLRRKN